MFEKKVALITGASGAIGSEIVRKLTKAGADVAIHYFKNKLNATKLAQQVTELGCKAYLVSADIADYQSADSMVKSVYQEFGRIDFLVNNAGMAKDRLLSMLTEKDWDEVLDICINGTFYCAKAVSEYMIRQKSGKIVNISSVTGICGQVTRTNYGAAKAAVLSLTRTLARDLAKDGIYVNAVAPGVLNAGLSKTLPYNQKMVHISMTPVGRLGKAEEIADVVLFLLSPASNFITGEVITASGGEVSWYL